MGWAIRKNYQLLRSIADELPLELNVLFWIDYIESNAIDKFAKRDALTWSIQVASALSYHSGKSVVAAHPPVSNFLKLLASEVTQPGALDPASQFTDFNVRGFQLAQQLIQDSDWSTSRVRDSWQNQQQANLLFVKARNGNFWPATASTRNCIEINVNTANFDSKNALIYYLTLDFQFMHEYVSHCLPRWNSGNPLEEEFLLGVMFLYYRGRCETGGFISLVCEADQLRRDSHRLVRNFIKDELALGQEERLCQVLLELAVMDDAQMPMADKRHLLALLKRTTAQAEPLRSTMRHWIKTESISEIYAKLKTVLGKPKPSPILPIT